MLRRRFCSARGVLRGLFYAFLYGVLRCVLFDVPRRVAFRTVCLLPLLLELLLLPFLLVGFPILLPIRILLFLLLCRLWRRHDGATTFRRTTAADVQLFVRIGVLSCALVGVVVRQLGAGRNVLQRRNEDAAVLLLDRLAVRIAAMIDVLRRPVDRTGVEHT